MRRRRGGSRLFFVLGFLRFMINEFAVLLGRWAGEVEKEDEGSGEGERGRRMG